MALTTHGTTAGDTAKDRGNDADESAVPDDAGTDANVDPGLIVTAAEEPSKAGPAHDDESGSTNRTGLTPDSIPVD